MIPLPPSGRTTMAVDGSWPRSPVRDRLGAALVATPLLTSTILAKLSLPPLGARGLGFLFPAIGAALLISLATNRLRVDMGRARALVVTLLCIGTSQILNVEHMSYASLVLLVFILTSFSVRQTAIVGLDLGNMFRSVALTIAVLGLIQFIAQRAIGDMAFPVERLVPSALRTQRFNSLAVLSESTFRPNGVLLLEPADFSQLCALGLISELCSRGRRIPLIIYTLAIVFSYSGTGLMILSVALPAFVLARRRWGLLAPGGFLVVLLILLAHPLKLDIIVDRAMKFGSYGSSGYTRFLGWLPLFSDHFWNNWHAIIFGNGSGAFSALAANGYAVAELSLPKIVFEYGVISGVAYSAFICILILRLDAPAMFRLALAVFYVINPPYSQSVVGIVASFAWFDSDTDSAARMV